MHKWIIAEVHDRIGFITLNSEKTLNALSLEMANELHQLLLDWKSDPTVACVFLQGAGERAFCAGGDIRKLYEVMVKRQDPRTCPPECLEFFIKEYGLDLEIHRYPKPIVLWGHGIVMGGGIGLMNGASLRVVTEKTLMAMPEISIGLYPDVGATWFYNRLPPGFGIFLGLTAGRFTGPDAIYLGMADRYVPSTRKPEIISALRRVRWTQDNETNKQLAGQAVTSETVPPAPLKQLAPLMATLEGVSTVAQFRHLVATFPGSEWITKCLANFEHGSPTSAAVILEQLRRGKHLTLEEVFQAELNLSIQFTKHPDFQEGIRALLVDKDQRPKWVPAQAVTPAYIEEHFKR